MKNPLPPHGRPNAPTPAEADLNGFPFMPLHVSRLLASDLVTEATGDEFRAAVLLWCAAWHQVPAGSLPTSDAALARLAQYGRDVQSFQAVKKGALRGWYECADGRLYHPVIAALVIDAWGRRIKNSGKASSRWSRKKTEGGVSHVIDNKQTHTCYSIATALPQQSRSNAIDRDIDIDMDTPPKSPKGTEQGLFAERIRQAKEPDGEHERFAEFWEIWRQAKPAAKNPRKPASLAFTKACKGANPDDIIAGARKAKIAYAEKREWGGDYVPAGAAWLNQCRWVDMLSAAEQATAKTKPPDEYADVWAHVRQNVAAMRGEKK